jgi:hypothetical protein
MAIDEGSRHRLYQRLDEVLGSEEATTLMSLLPPAGFNWSELSTKADLEAHRLATKEDLTALRLATRADLQAHRQETKSDLQAHRHETRADLQAHRQETKADLETLGRELRLEWRADIEGMSRRLIAWTSSLVVGGIGLAFAIARVAF